MATYAPTDRSAVVLRMSLVAIVFAGVVGRIADTAEADPGAREWVTRHDRPTHSFDRAAAVADGGDGTRIFVTGTSSRTRLDQDYATIAYTTT